jgi:hypothetical protein
MALRESAAGTEVWFTELFADKIGVVRRASDGTYSENHFSCACKVPKLGEATPFAGTPSGIDLDAAANIWFTAANKSTVAKLTPPADPFSTTVATIEHYKIPSFVTVNEPDIGGIFATAVPHSVNVGPDGKVWFTELATAKVGWLDPAQASAGTTQGMHEIGLGTNDFGADNQPADLVADPAGTVFVTDEYGDQITAVTPSGVKEHWRPTERVSLTDQPMTDAQGNLWFIEAGANLVTRIKGIAATQGAGGTPPGGGSTGGGGGGTTSGGSVDVEKVACAKRHWVYGTAAAPRVILLGQSTSKVAACLGKPTSKSALTWKYGNRIHVHFRQGKVTSFVLLDGAFRAETGGIGVGTRATSLKRLSSARGVRRSAGAYTTQVKLPSGGRAVIAYAVAKGRVTRITVTLRAK